MVYFRIYTYIFKKNQKQTLALPLNFSWLQKAFLCLNTSCTSVSPFESQLWLLTFLLLVYWGHLCFRCSLRQTFFLVTKEEEAFICFWVGILLFWGGGLFSGWRSFDSQQIVYNCFPYCKQSYPPMFYLEILLFSNVGIPKWIFRETRYLTIAYWLP